MRITGVCRVLAGLSLVAAVATAGLRPSKLPLTTRTIDVSDYVTCAGDVDATAAFGTALTAAAGNTLWIPSGCLLRFGTPGAGAAVATIPSNTAIICEDQSAGFAVARKRCVGGTYGESAVCTGANCIGAACTTSAECTGGGTCAFDFGSSVFAPTTATTYTILKDGGATVNPQDIRIENCSFWTAQAEPYQRCVGGTSAGNPCRQECTGGSLPGFRCTVDADCAGGGTCLRVADCQTGGGTCTGVPLKPSTVGTAKINPLDLSTTAFTRIINVGVYDHFQGDFGIKVGNWGTMRDTHVAREITDCSSPLATPTDSTCLNGAVGGSSGSCCYGALNFTTSNTQPTTTVTDGVSVGANAQLIRVTGRGTSTAIRATDNTRLDECTAWPPSAVGPGTAGGGYSVGVLSQLAKSYALFLGTGTTGITLTGANASAIENRLAGSYTTGILMSGANGHAIGNNLTGLAAASGIGISATGDYGYIAGNYIEGNSTTGTAIKVATGSGFTIQGNQIKSNASDTLQYGVDISANNVIVTDNQVDRVAVAAFRLGAFSGSGITSNRTTLSPARATTTLQPAHVLSDQGASQIRITGNTFNYGWRGINQGTNATGFNLQVIGNRFQGLAGAAVAHGGAGINVIGNYINQGFGFASGPSLMCDPSCTGGNGRGQVCTQDSNCTTCAAGATACQPEPVAGFVGNPRAASATPGQHNQWMDNLMYFGWTPNVVAWTAVTQCTAGAAGIGALCQVSTCAGGGVVCSGGPPATCQSGTDVGKYCCGSNGAAGTCTARSNTPMLKFVDGNLANGHNDGTIATNTIFGTTGITNVTGIAMHSGLTTSAQTINRFQIAGNQFSAPSATGTVAIQFPSDTTGAANTRNVQVGDQAFINGWGTVLQNYQSAFGSYLPQNGDWLSGSSDQFGTTAVTTFFTGNGNIADNATPGSVDFYAAPSAGTIWKMGCAIDTAPGGTSTRAFTLRQCSNAACTATDSAMTCTIGSAALTCQPAAGAASAPLNFVAGDRFVWKHVSTVGGSLADAAGTCFALVTYSGLPFQSP